MRSTSIPISLAAILMVSGCAFTNDFSGFRRAPDGSTEPMDGSVSTPDGGPDGGTVSCVGESDCDDGVSCTTDRCVDGACVHTPNDGECTAGGGGQCDPVRDCQYDECNAATCVAGPCQTATCEGTVCVRENTCASDQTCCGSACVRSGCDDDVACTVDSCGPDGCANVPDDSACDDGDPCTVGVCTPTGCMQTPAANGTECDDGVYCNGADSCQAGVCSGHAGNPCPGASRCEEAVRSCTGCVSNSDCPAPVEGTYTACSFGTTCATSGTQSRTVTTFQCMAGTCQSSAATETRSCTRTTESTSCGTASCGSYGSCNWASTCATTSTQSRTCTSPTCRSGGCVNETSTETQACPPRATEGIACGPESCSGWSTCSFINSCATSGTQTRTCTGVCRSGSCAAESRTETRSCTRSSTDGSSCGSAVCSYGTCMHDGMCGGQQSGSCTPRVCMGGMCRDGTAYTDTRNCPFFSDGFGCSVGGAFGSCCSGTCRTGGEVCAIK